ncbi:hypothetical protein CKM354_000107900 [Cercospora kikuchii]|uniref:BTB domain-containing protein n=1 Tax=Cercospora kikuchii TaxID=84275 RepID=A0A9P3FBL7_9PEZI|nr:uncharacterized protein CKM354_000107900 [Cercospora kikuchii]GIZ37637.1 hypothetical protein CKM354_000107900 [Cercospora kikuchii]
MGDEIRAARRRRITNNIITITVGQGPESEKFLVHDFLLKENSKFFEAALNRQWIEGQEKKVNLPDDDPLIFSIYADWLFTGKIASKPEQLEQPEYEVNWPDVSEEQIIQAELYVLGEKLMDDAFCDCILRALVEVGKMKAWIGHEGYMPCRTAIRIIYNGTTHDSPMRKFLVDMYGYHGGKESFTEANVYGYPQEFLAGLVGSLIAKRDGQTAENPEDNLKPYFKCN